METQQNLALFQELMLVSGDVCTWRYDSEGQLLSSNCPDQAVMATAFDAFGCLERMLAMAKERSMPVFLSTDMGLTWGAAFEKTDGELTYCHVIGPVFYADVSTDFIRQGIRSRNLTHYSAAWLNAFYDAIDQVPSSQFTIFSRNLMMLHYCVTGQRIGVSDILTDDIQTGTLEPRKKKTDRHRVWKAETALLQMVRQGNLNYKDALDTSMMISNGVNVNTKDPMRTARTSAIVFCSIVCRAAIEGGLSPEEAYSLGDAYIQSVLDARNIEESSTICMTMYDDFIRRVHRIKEKPNYSEPIRRCCNYIEMNLDRNIHAPELAEMVNYSETYLTRRFREETGIGIADYVRLVRVERAKVLLKTTELSIQEIADRLGFTTRSYFGQSFRQVTGLTPKEYRSKP